MVFTTDDLCLLYLKNFGILDDFKKDNPDFKIIAFTISNYGGIEDLKTSDIFKKWYNRHKDWVEIAVHSYEHIIPDGDLDEKECIKKALDSLKEYLPRNYGYRSAGWQTTCHTVPILKELGFSWIAYERQVNDIVHGRVMENQITNSHVSDKKSLIKLIQQYEILRNNNRKG